MENRPAPYQAIGTFVLFRKLEEGHLADLWRGAALEGPSRGEPVAIHRFKAGDPVALRNAATGARERLREIRGATIARDQATEVVGSSALLIHEYAGGRSLRGIVERASRPASPHPIPVDQALAIVERISASLQALHAFRAGGARLVHGAVVPQFVWITEDGEVRLAGQHLAAGVIASVKDPRVRAEIGAFLAPEIHAGGEPSIAGDIFSVGAILHLALTGKAPAPQTTGETLAKALDAARIQFDDEPLPPELRSILERTLAPEPSKRYASFDELHQTLTRFATGGDYAPTTFNLAFYLHTLMKKEREEETEERKREHSADLTAIAARAKDEGRLAGAASAVPSVPAAAPVATAAPPPEAVSGSPLSQPLKPRSKAPLFAAAALVVAAVGGGAYFILGDRDAAPGGAVPPSLAAAAMAPQREAPPPPAPVLTAIAEPAAGTEPAAPAPAAPQATADEEARRQAFEEEVNRRLQAEVGRLQREYEKQLAAERAKAAPRPAPEQPPQQTARTAAPAAPPAVAATAADLSAADRLNQQRLEQLRSEPAAAAAVETALSAPPASAPAVEPAAAPAAAPAVREGDLVEHDAVDKPPSLIRSVPPVYPPFARQRKLRATIIVTALITETGDVAEVRILRGDARDVGFNEAAMQAVKQAKFAPATKDGKRVRTWLAMPVSFQLR